MGGPLHKCGYLRNTGSSQLRGSHWQWGCLALPVVCEELCGCADRVCAQQCVFISVCAVVCLLSYLYISTNKDERFVHVYVCSFACASDFLSPQSGFCKPNLLVPIPDKHVHPIPFHPYRDEEIEAQLSSSRNRQEGQAGRLSTVSLPVNQSIKSAPTHQHDGK